MRVRTQAIILTAMLITDTVRNIAFWNLGHQHVIPGNEFESTDTSLFKNDRRSIPPTFRILG